MTIREAMKELPKQDREALLCAFNGHFSHVVRFRKWIIGVNAKLNIHIVEQKGAWILGCEAD